MQAAFDYALDYVHERHQFSQPIGTFQLMQGKTTDMYTKLAASRSLVYAVVSRRDCASAILYLMEAMQHLGGNRYISGLHSSSTACQVFDDFSEYPTGR